MAHQSAQRYQTAGELGVALERPGAPVSAAGEIPARSAVGKPSGRNLGLAIAAAAALVIVIGGYFVFFAHHKTQMNSAPLVVNRRRSVAVLGFKNLTANPQKSWLSTALSEMLTTELSQGDQLRTIPGESVAQMKMSLALPDAESFGQETLTRIRQNLGSDDVVMGSYLRSGQRAASP